MNNMKFFFILILFLFIISSGNFSLADIEKGKWNFVKDPDYCYIGSAPIEEDIPEGKKSKEEFLRSKGLQERPNSLMAIKAWEEYIAS